MSTTAGALAKITVGTTTDTVSSVAATAGSSPVTYQWYRSTVSGFTAGAGSLLSGATSLLLNDTGLQPGTNYYYLVVAIDSAATSGTSAQLGVITAPAQSQNQFTQSVVIGMLDQQYNYDTMSVQIDTSETGTLFAGTAVKMASTAGGTPKVVQCTANSDTVLGFVNFNIKDISYVAGERCEISIGGNVMYLISVGAITRGAQVQLDLTYTGGVKTKTGASGAAIVGWAFDGATGDGQPMRVHITSPSFAVA